MNGREIFPSNLAGQKFYFSMEAEDALLSADCQDNKRSLHILESTVPSGGNGLFTGHIIPKKDATIGSVSSNYIYTTNSDCSA
jgi:hypothetical protein